MDENIELEQRQTLIRQDEKLNRIGQGVSVLKAMAVDIGTELDDSNAQLAGLDMSIDNTQSRLNRTTDKVNILINKTKGKKFCCVICLLIIILIILVVVFTH